MNLYVTFTLVLLVCEYANSEGFLYRKTDADTIDDLAGAV